LRKRENYLEDGISAILPIYTEGVGDTTLLINLEGQKRIIHKKIKSVLKGIAASLSYDIVELRRKYGELLNQKSKIPLPLRHDLILMPVMVRYPLIQGDETLGYINYRQIEQVIREGKHCKVVLKNGVEIKLLLTLSVKVPKTLKSSDFSFLKCANCTHTYPLPGKSLCFFNG